jgi:phosphoserine/homoserine phosphotransferase
MKVVCLDLEGVLVPEIWIAVASSTGIPELRRTTRDEPDYDKLMRERITILKAKGIKLADVQKVISDIDPLPGACEFARLLREKTQLIILSDTFSEFAAPLMSKLSYPTIFCNSLIVEDGFIAGHKLRQPNGKFHAVRALKSIGMEVFAAGDSFNDLAMIAEASLEGGGALFRAPPAIAAGHPEIPQTETYDGLMAEIDKFLLYSR